MRTHTSGAAETAWTIKLCYFSSRARALTYTSCCWMHHFGHWSLFTTFGSQVTFECFAIYSIFIIQWNISSWSQQRDYQCAHQFISSFFSFLRIYLFFRSQFCHYSRLFLLLPCSLLSSLAFLHAQTRYALFTLSMKHEDFYRMHLKCGDHCTSKLHICVFGGNHKTNVFFVRNEWR